MFDFCRMWGKKACFARHFDLLRNSNLTVPMYADTFELLVFVAPLTSASLPKKVFLTDCKGAVKAPFVYLISAKIWFFGIAPTP